MSDETATPTVQPLTKIAAVKLCLEAGVTAPQEGVAAMRERYGLDISRAAFSALKCRLAKGDLPQARARTQPRKYHTDDIEPGVLPPADTGSHIGNGHIALPAKAAFATVDTPTALAALAQLKPIVRLFGGDVVKQMVDVLCLE